MSNGNGHLWSKFWWQDWQNDNALKRCSLAARGLWMAMLCIAHDGEPCGYLRLNGQALTAEDLNDMIAKTTVKEVERLLGELEAKGVFSRAEDGAIYSRRMVKDAAATETGREHIAKRWNAAKPTDPPNRGANREPNRQAYNYPNRDPTGDPITKKLEAESRKPPVGPHGVGTSAPQAGTPLRRADGTNLRAAGSNPRAIGTNPRETNTNLRANGTNPRRNSRNAFHDLVRQMDAEEAGITIEGTSEVIDFSRVRGIGHG